jgi:hypothetical protein
MQITSAETAFIDGLLSEATRQAAKNPAIRRANWQTGLVTAVNTDGTVSIGTVRARRVESYQNPAVGDLIFLDQSGMGNWRALGRTAAASEVANQPYIPVWTSDGTNPVLNNGTLNGRFWKHGTYVKATINLGVGSQTTLGTGSYFWQLPTNMSATALYDTGTAQLLISGGNRWGGQAVLSPADTNRVGVFMPTAAANAALRRLSATNASPDGALNSSTQLRITVQYEAAS